ncbi:MAG: DUF4136 domain-containing protein [Shewanella sp.]
MSLFMGRALSRLGPLLLGVRNTPASLGQKLRAVNLVGTGLLSLMLCACSSVSQDASQALRTTVVISGDLSQLPATVLTYSWHPQLQKVKVDKRLDQQEVLKHVQKVLQHTLQTKGYRWVEDAELADFQVGFGVALGTEMTDAQILAAAGLVPGLSTQGVNLKQYDKGSIFIGFFKPTGIPPQPAQLVWRVLAQGFANIGQMDELTARFDDLIAEMLLTLPMTQGSK